MSPLMELFALAGTITSAGSKWLLGNKNPFGWALAVVSAAFWMAVSMEAGSKVMMANNAITLALVVRGCYKWRNQ
jgi:hypothetical protein